MDLCLRGDRLVLCLEACYCGSVGVTVVPKLRVRLPGNLDHQDVGGQHDRVPPTASQEAINVSRVIKCRRFEN